MKITADKILFFDLDGTLIDTDYLNWYSYMEAWKIIDVRSFEGGKKYYEFDVNQRMNYYLFSSLIDFFCENPEKIRPKKQEIYSKKIYLSKKIEENVDILKRFSKTNKIVLVSNAKKKRGLETLRYHKLEQYFHKMFFAEDKTLSDNKYENAIKSLGINPLNVIAFEDCGKEIDKAIKAGISCINESIDGGDNIKEIFEGAFKHSTPKTLIYQNEDAKIRLEIDDALLKEILENKNDTKVYVDESKYYFQRKEGELLQPSGVRYKILKEGLKEFIIEPNIFLKQEVRAFYHKDYFGSGNWNTQGKIEHLIWSIKNDTGSKNSHRRYLATAYKRLKNILRNDIREIYRRIEWDKYLGNDKLTICVVPRAKEGYIYEKNQLLFRQAVFEILEELGEDFIDGTQYIVRHTSTGTTHLNDYNEGKRPYVGITKDTCYISDNVIGKDILLIDDVYTKTANVDEDVIQALLDKGARNIYFYAVGNTYSYR